MKKFYLFLWVPAMFAQAWAGDFGGFIRVDSKGAMNFDGIIKAGIIHYSTAWSPRVQTDLTVTPGFPRTNTTGYEMEGMFFTSGDFDFFRFRQHLQIVKSGIVQAKYALTSAKPIPSNTLALEFRLPPASVKVSVDGKIYPLDPNLLRKGLLNKNASEVRLEFPENTLIVTGEFKVQLQGCFPSDNCYALRLSNRNTPKEISDWEMKITIKNVNQAVGETEFSPINLAKIANMGFADKEAGDNKGGWTDQGPIQDLRGFKPGKLSFAGIPFEVPNPLENNGRSCVVLGRNLLKETGIAVSGNAEKMNSLYLLHASAWTPAYPGKIGFLDFIYVDDSRKTVPVVSGEDCGNWWGSILRYKNALPVWRGEVSGQEVGLYLSIFPLEKTVREIRFRRGTDALWMVVGATLGSRKIPLPSQRETPMTIRAGKEYFPVEFTADIVTGSPLDFSSALDAPAGKYGNVIVGPNGHFVFRNAPNKRIRFLGTNLVSSANYLTKEQTDEFVERAAKQGYNSVRLHHFENDLLDKKANDSLTFDPKALDKLHYLVAQCKARGMYICIDLYASRKPRPGDAIHETKKFVRYEMKSLIPMSSSAMNNWKAFAEKFLKTVNPYTGYTWAEEPALYSLNLINENNLSANWRNCPEMIPVYEEKFNIFLKKNPIVLPFTRNGRFMQFLNEVQAGCIAEQIRFLREEVKLKCLITDLNYLNSPAVIPLREKLDFVDNHQYWDHPRFAGKLWALPYLYHNRSAIADNAALPRNMMPTRIFGKPFTVTEFNFSLPNRYRIEGGPLLGAYAALQDWDGLYRFAWSHTNSRMENPKVALNHFDSVNNLQAQMSDRILHALFLQGNVQTAKEAYALIIPPEEHGLLKIGAGTFPYEQTLLGLHSGIGAASSSELAPNVKPIYSSSRDWREALSATADSALRQLEESGKITSSTGEIKLDTKAKLLEVTTPKIETAVFEKNADLGIMKLRNGTVYQTVALISLDGNKLEQSKNMLLIHLTDWASEGMTFSDSKRTALINWGKYPHLLQRGGAEVELTVPRKLKVEALKFDGSPNGEVPITYEKGKLHFLIRSDLRKEGVIAYHIHNK